MLKAKNTFLGICIVLFCSTVRAQQSNQVMNLPKYDRRFFQPGFLLGFNSASFRVQLVDDFRVRDSIYTVVPHAELGLNLGIVANFRMGEHFEWRFVPSLAFTQRNLEYDLAFTDTLNKTVNENITKTVESTYLEFPVALKYKSVRIDNYRIYVLAGFKYSIDMVSQAKVLAKDKEIVKLTPRDYGYEVGLGFDFYLTYFKFSPEIKMFNGMSNLLVEDNRTFVKPLKGLYSKTFMISFLFQ